MKRLISTTALATLMALPLTAQTQDNSANATQGNAQMEQQQSAIEVQTLIGQRIYMPRNTASGGMTGSDTDEASSTDSGNMGLNLPTSVREAPNDWQMVGEIRDLLVETDGRVTAMIVDAGGFLGMGESEKQVSVQNVTFVRDSDDEGDYFVVFNGGRSTFEEQTSYDAETAESQGVQRASEAGYLKETDSDMQEVSLSGVTTSEFLGAAAYGENDNWVGEISELALTDDGKIDAFIVDVGGFLGLGEKAVAMSMDQVKLTRIGGDELRAYVTATEDELDSMEAWNPSEM